jgi:uncharacterized membrane protein
MTDTPHTPPAPGAPRWMKVLLALSLGFNLAVLGLVAGTALRHMGDRPLVRDIGFGPFTEALSAQDRQELRRAFQREGGDMRKMHRQMRSDMGNLLSVLRQNPLQEDALRSALLQMEERGQERLALGQRLMAGRILAMSPAERAAFADRLERMMASGGRDAPPPPGQ